MIGRHPTAFLLALALAAGPATGADFVQDYQPPVPGDGVFVDARFPPPLQGVPIGQEGAGAYARFPPASSQLPPHGAAARIKDIAQLQSARGRGHLRWLCRDSPAWRGSTAR